MLFEHGKLGARWIQATYLPLQLCWSWDELHEQTIWPIIFLTISNLKNNLWRQWVFEQCLSLLMLMLSLTAPAWAKPSALFEALAIVQPPALSSPPDHASAQLGWDEATPGINPSQPVLSLPQTTDVWEKIRPKLPLLQVCNSSAASSFLWVNWGMQGTPVHLKKKKKDI